MQQLRIVIGDMPRLTREIIGVMLEQQPDMTIVDHGVSPADLVAVALRERADAAIVALPDDELPALYASLLHSAPALRLLALVREGQRAFLFVLRPYCVALGELSAAQLADAIRTPQWSAVGAESWPSIAALRAGEGQ